MEKNILHFLSLSSLPSSNCLSLTDEAVDVVATAAALAQVTCLFFRSNSFFGRTDSNRHRNTAEEGEQGVGKRSHRAYTSSERVRLIEIVPFPSMPRSL